jgi:hypothetical protein
MRQNKVMCLKNTIDKLLSSKEKEYFKIRLSQVKVPGVLQFIKVQQQCNYHPPYPLIIAVNLEEVKMPTLYLLD